jgi:hypothetical protein
VIERRRGTRLATDALPQVALPDRAVQHLDGNMAMQPGGVRAVDAAHPAGTERGDDFVRADCGSGRQRHGLIIQSSGHLVIWSFGHLVI